jgi:hypothetical protein
MVHLKLETEILGLRCSFNEGEALEFSYKPPTPVVVSFKKDGGRSASIANAICTAITNLDIEPDVKADIHQAIEDDHVNWGKIKLDNRNMIDNCFSHLRELSLSTIKIFNWTHGLDGPSNPLGLSYAFYLEGGEQWLQYSLARSGRFLTEEATYGIFAKDAQIEEVVRRVEAGAEEPLARQVFREAWGQIGVNPRSSCQIERRDRDSRHQAWRFWQSYAAQIRSSKPPGP